jgi:phage shock protein E
MHPHPYTIIDVRSPAEYAEGSIPGAINIPLQDIPSRAYELKDRTPLLVYCMSGGRSHMAKEILMQHGITEIINGGGILQAQDLLSKASGHARQG